MTDPAPPTRLSGRITDAYVRGMRDAAAMLDLSPQTIRLPVGEMSAAEMRTVRAVLAWRRREMLNRAERTGKAAQPLSGSTVMAPPPEQG